MSEWTPGPWGIIRNAWDVCSVYAPNGQTIAMLEHWESHAEEDVDERAIHDARLIAAAPELLEACKLALASLMDPAAGQLLTIKALEAALEKAGVKT